MTAKVRYNLHVTQSPYGEAQAFQKPHAGPDSTRARDGDTRHFVVMA